MQQYATATALALILGLGLAAPSSAQSPQQSSQVPPNEQRQGQAAQPSGRTPGQRSADPRLMGVRVEQLIGTDVKNLRGFEVGEVKDIVVDRQGRASYAILSVGGFLGIGEKDIAVPITELRLDQDSLILMWPITEEELERLPAYRGDFEPYERNRRLSDLGWY